MRQRVHFVGDAFENIGEAVGDRIHQFDKDGAAAQRFAVGCHFAIDEIGERSQFLEPHRDQAIAGQDETDRGRHRQLGLRSIN